ncbi:MAG: hypothetical protein QXZ54_05070 [Candidatus Methanomethylicia archaeon]
MNEKIVKVHKKIAEKILNYGSSYWDDCTIYTSKYEDSHIIPELLAISIAEEIEGTVILDTSRLQKEVILEFLENFDKKPSIFEFSTNSVSIPDAYKIKIGIENIRENAKLFSKIMTTYNGNSEVEEEMEEEVMCLDNVNELSNIIIMSYMPPKIREKMKLELKEYVKKRGKMELIMNIAGIIGGLMVNPMMVAPKGIAILQETIKNIGRKDLSINEIVEWAKPEILSEIVEEGEGTFKELKPKEFNIIFCDLKHKIHKPFQLLLVWSLINSIEGKIVLSNANEITKIEYLREIIKIKSKEKGLKIVYIFQGEEEFNGWLGDKNVIFNIKTSDLMKIIKNEDLMHIAQIIHNFSENKCVNQYDKIRFIIKYMDGPWKLMEVNINDGWKDFVKNMFIKLMEIAA